MQAGAASRAPLAPTRDSKHGRRSVGPLRPGRVIESWPHSEDRRSKPDGRNLDHSRDQTTADLAVGEITTRATPVSAPAPEKAGQTKLPRLQKTGRVVEQSRTVGDGGSDVRRLHRPGGDQRSGPFHVVGLGLTVPIPLPNEPTRSRNPPSSAAALEVATIDSIVSPSAMPARSAVATQPSWGLTPPKPTTATFHPFRSNRANRCHAASAPAPPDATPALEAFASHRAWLPCRSPVSGCCPGWRHPPRPPPSPQDPGGIEK